MTKIITRQMVLDAAKISQEIIKHKLNRQFMVGEKNAAYNTYIRGLSDAFSNKYDQSPNLIMKDILDQFLIRHKISQVYKVTQHHYRHRVLNAYVWACITMEKPKDPDDDNPQHVDLPQMYILINGMGIRFGCVYGDRVKATSRYVNAVINNTELQKRIYNAIQTDENNLCIWVKEGSGEFLPANNDKRPIHKWSDVSQGWCEYSRLIGYFYKADVPNDIHDRINDTLDSLLPIYKVISNV
jgi:hypothetical protein